MDTIISRFSKSFGFPVPMRHSPLVYGSERKDIGLTTDLETMITSWYRRFHDEYQRYPKKGITLSAWDSIPKHTELEYRAKDLDGNLIECYWQGDDLLSCMHILDNKPFKRLSVHYFPFELMPLSITRDKITVIITPRVMKVREYQEPQNKKWHGNPWTSGKLKFDWIRPLYNTTFWLIRYNGESLPMYPTGYEMVKCYNCGMEFSKQDYINQVIQRYHPRCSCSCNTYDDFCGCVRMRERRAIEKKSREIVKIRHWQRKYSKLG